MPASFPRMIGNDLIQNGSFAEGQTTTGGALQSFSTLPGWQTNAGSAPLEVVSDGYNGIVSGEGWWLDTQATPGGIDISQTVDLANGKAISGLLTFEVAAENIGGLTTGADHHLDFYFNGDLVGSITAAQVLALSGGDYNEFVQFSFAVEGQPGPDTLRIVDVGPAANVGFALTDIDLHKVVTPVGMAHNDAHGTGLLA